jgi:hypothetical protein
VPVPPAEATAAPSATTHRSAYVQHALPPSTAAPTQYPHVPNPHHLDARTEYRDNIEAAAHAPHARTPKAPQAALQQYPGLQLGGSVAMEGATLRAPL